MPAWILTVLGLVVLVLIAVGFGSWASAIAKKKGLSPGGFFALGFFLGAIGVIIAALVGSANPPTPAGMTPVACPRCNARQNIALGARGFECWQCKTRISEPG